MSDKINRSEGLSSNRDCQTTAFFRVQQLQMA